VFSSEVETGSRKENASKQSRSCIWHSSGTGSRMRKFERIKFPLESFAENFRPKSNSAELQYRYFTCRLASARNRYSTPRMSRWRLAMRELSAEARLHLYARSLSRKTGTGFHAAALYGAFALIAGIVFGTLSIHPF
jgi:hypothetical protein